MILLLLTSCKRLQNTKKLPVSIYISKSIYSTGGRGGILRFFRIISDILCALKLPLLEAVVGSPANHCPLCFLLALKISCS